jgi:hypothetical protein
MMLFECGMLVRDPDARLGRVACIDRSLVKVKYADGAERIWNGIYLQRVLH